MANDGIIGLHGVNLRSNRSSNAGFGSVKTLRVAAPARDLRLEAIDLQTTLSRRYPPSLAAPMACPPATDRGFPAGSATWTAAPAGCARLEAAAGHDGFVSAGELTRAYATP